MKNLRFNEKYKLISENIDTISEILERYLEQRQIAGKEALRLRISLENVLLSWQESLGKDSEVEVSMSARRRSVYVQVSCPGDQRDPFVKTDDLDDWARSLRKSMESVPEYEYISHTNIVSFKISKPQVSRFLIVLIHLAIGILIGLSGFLLSDEVRQSICSDVISPVYNVYLNLFSLCGVPLIFLSIVTGIIGVGSIRSFQRIGKKMILHFLLTTVSVIVLTMVVGVIAFRPDLSGTAGTIQYAEFLSMILGWIPANIIQPFIDCNAMQLVLLGVAAAMAILLLGGSKSSHLSGFLFDMNNLMLEFSRWFTTLIPLFVLVTIVYSMWQSEIPVLLSAWKSWVVTTAMQAVAILLILPVICRKHHVSVWQLMKKVSKTFFIALGTNSCAASINANYESCGGKMGIDNKIYSFGIPVGTTVYKPATAVRLVILCLFMVTSGYPMPVSAGWIFMLGIMAFVLSIATPAIPGGTLMLCTMLFTQLSIPTEVLSQMLTTDVFFDCVCTAFNQVAVTLSLTSYASSVGMLDADILKKKQ